MNLRNALLGATAPVPPGVIFMAATSIEDLQAEVVDLEEASAAIVAKADAESRDLSDAEIEEIEANAEKAGKTVKQIEARQKIKVPVAVLPRKTGADPVEPGTRTRVEPTARAGDPRFGFKNFGEFAKMVNRHARGNEDAVTRFQNVATTYGSEGTGADGGFAVPPEFRREIWQKVMDQENLLGRCAQLVTGSNNITIPKDETTPWQTTGGIQVYWEAEAAAATASKPALEMSTMRLNKLMALVPVSDELLEDAPGLESWLRAKAPSKMAAKINTAIVRGTGVGQPLGILNAGCLVTVAAEAAQTADTVWFGNINKMWSRLYAPSRANAIWLINQDVEPSLDAMAFDPAATSKTPVYLGPTGVAGSPYATLKGRPVVPIEACSTLGDKGDIILADLTQYWALTKGQDVKSDVSMHLYFDQGLQAFRFTFRVNGQPAWGSTISPENGSATRSCFVAVADRTG